MITKRQLREQILHLKHRISDLEERLCPCESHKWELINIYLRSIYDDFDIIYVYQCSRCGKAKEAFIPEKII